MLCNQRPPPCFTKPKHSNLYKFFEEEFGFDEEDTVVVMGAHSMGRLAKEVGT
jgi:hypothetical protein